MNDTDVIIAGAGPVGLLLAIELVNAGVRPIVIERLTAPDLTVKAGAMGALAGEALERRGFAGAMAAHEEEAVAKMRKMFAASNPSMAIGKMPFAKIGGHFAGLFLIDQSRQKQPDRRLRGLNQQALESMLGARATELGIDVRRGVEVMGFEDGPDGVVVRVRKDDREETLRAQWLAGCDGGRSVVRKTSGFEFPGTDPTITGYQAIVELDHPDRLLPLGWRRTPVGMMAYGPVPGRIYLTEFDGPPVDRRAPITIEEVEASLRRVSGADVRILEMKSVTRFTDNARQATAYRKGHVVLAGDAAHVHSPFGGQGLNLGLLDAVNLGWKLAAVVKKTKPDTFVDTYTAERHPVGAKVLANTRAQIALMRPDPFTTELRSIVSDLMGTDQGNQYFGEMMSGITTRYELGSDHPLVGTLTADRALEGATLFAAMAATPAVVVATGERIEKKARKWLQNAAVLRAAEGPSTFVRPDGCIAWASDDGGDEGLEAALDRWLGSPQSST